MLEVIEWATVDGVWVTLRVADVAFRCAIKGRDDVLQVVAQYAPREVLIESDSFGQFVRACAAPGVEALAVLVAGAIAEATRADHLYVWIGRDEQAGVQLAVEVGW